MELFNSGEVLELLRRVLAQTIRDAVRGNEARNYDREGRCEQPEQQARPNENLHSCEIDRFGIRSTRADRKNWGVCFGA